jgi:hypothetical protein
MSIDKNIKPFDLRLYQIVILPGFLAFLFLGMIAEGNKWISWFMCLGGWYLSSLIWWHMYQHFMINKFPPSRKAFYGYFSLAQIALVFLVYVFIRIEYAI